MAAPLVVKYAMSREGKNVYTQDARRYSPGEGFSDCSSLMWWAYKSAYGIGIGDWTGTQLEHGEVVEVYDMKPRPLTKAECDRLEPGDLVFFGGGTGAHVEMYIGDYRLFGHGSGVPSQKDALTYVHRAGLRMARRYWSEPVVKGTAGDVPTKDGGGAFSPTRQDELVSLRVRHDIARGAVGHWVAVLQALLRVHGQLIDIDGDFGPKTEEAVKVVQRAHDLKPDGYVGPNTWRALWDGRPCT